ncbi:MAG: hypothetical protein PF569_04485 [Candidatus Woesearchaeota archaeon]|jgi:hypothetical protein|nr:hypothetical protein [Candidatus Woesearchaeota archaeon]
MFWIFELLIALMIAYVFIKRERPKVKFLIYGYLFFLVSLVLQIPFKFLQLTFKDYFSSSVLPIIFLNIGVIVISELTKYFSLKRFLKTKSFKNGILFGIGWATIESISYFSLIFYSFFFGFFSLSFDYLYFLPESFPFVSFLLFFVLNLAITVFVIFSIIKKDKLYLIYAIIFSLVIFFAMLYLEKLALYIFEIFLFFYSLYIIYHYRKIK